MPVNLDCMSPTFQSTLSMRRATGRGQSNRRQQSGFQSTLSMRRATLKIADSYTSGLISIHALHEESDRFLSNEVNSFSISIHALHEESDGM